MLFHLQSCVYCLVSGKGLQFVVEEKITDIFPIFVQTDEKVSMKCAKSVN